MRVIGVWSNTWVLVELWESYFCQGHANLCCQQGPWWLPGLWQEIIYGSVALLQPGSWLISPKAMQIPVVGAVTWGQVAIWGSWCSWSYANLSGLHCHNVQWWHLNLVCFQEPCLDPWAYQNQILCWCLWLIMAVPMPGVWVTTWGYVGFQVPHYHCFLTNRSGLHCCLGQMWYISPRPYFLLEGHATNRATKIWVTCAATWIHVLSRQSFCQGPCLCLWCPWSMVPAKSLDAQDLCCILRPCWFPMDVLLLGQ